MFSDGCRISRRCIFYPVKLEIEEGPQMGDYLYAVVEEDNNGKEFKFDTPQETPKLLGAKTAHRYRRNMEKNRPIALDFLPPRGLDTLYITEGSKLICVVIKEMVPSEQDSFTRSFEKYVEQNILSDKEGVDGAEVAGRGGA